MTKDFQLEPIIVSEGTLRTEDLIPTFASTLRRRLVDSEREGRPVPESAWEILEDIEGMVESGDISYYDSANASYDLDWLFDNLNSYAPTGMYFGSAEGDGACFGFWSM